MLQNACHVEEHARMRALPQSPKGEEDRPPPPRRHSGTTTDLGARSLGIEEEEVSVGRSVQRRQQ